MTDTPPTGNKRLSRRRLPKSRVKASLRLGGLDLGVNLARTLVDLSESGACLIVQAALDPGREVSVGMEGQSHSRPLLRVGNVVWCKPAEAGAFLVGVSFQKRLAYTAYLELTQESR
jgi:hypothetical protein